MTAASARVAPPEGVMVPPGVPMTIPSRTARARSSTAQPEMCPKSVKGARKVKSYVYRLGIRPRPECQAYLGGSAWPWEASESKLAARLRCSGQELHTLLLELLTRPLPPPPLCTFPARPITGSSGPPSWPWPMPCPPPLHEKESPKTLPK